jgi:FtsZ-binding cell division protein ZapB
MISLEQIKLLEGKIARAIDLIRTLKEENATLRKGLDSAQRRMKELESLVDGFKSDQKEIESVILRTLKNLDELEETALKGDGAVGAARRKPDAPTDAGDNPSAHAVDEPPRGSPRDRPAGVKDAPEVKASGSESSTGRQDVRQNGARIPDKQVLSDEPGKGELDIF